MPQYLYLCHDTAFSTKMMYQCKDCGAIIDVYSDVQNSEIIGCADCGLDYVVEFDGSGSIIINELAIEGEDWGE